MAYLHTQDLEAQANARVKALRLPEGIKVHVQADLINVATGVGSQVRAILEFEQKWVEVMPEHIKNTCYMLDAGAGGDKSFRLESVGKRTVEPRLTGRQIDYIHIDDFLTAPFSAVEVEPIVTYRIILPDDFMPLLRDLSSNIHGDLPRLISP